MGEDLRTPLPSKSWLERAQTEAQKLLHSHTELRTEAVILSMLIEAYLIGAQHQWADLQKKRLMPKKTKVVDG